MNGLQFITSLLTIQSRATQNTEAAAQLTIAANRVAAIERVHRHLHALDHVKSVEFKKYLESLCHDLSGMASSESPGSVLVVDGTELRIPAVTGIALGFIASELITNAIKYAEWQNHRQIANRHCEWPRTFRSPMMASGCRKDSTQLHLMGLE